MVAGIFIYLLFFAMVYLLLAVRFGCFLPDLVRFSFKEVLFKLMASNTSESVCCLELLR